MGKCKIVNLNLKQKHDVIKMKENKKSVAEICQRFKCGKTQVYNILIKKDEIKKQFSEGNVNDLICRKRRETSYAQINEVLFEWFCAVRAKNLPISGPILQEMALKIGRKLNLIEFKASNGWLQCFRNRYLISFSTCSGEANEVCETTVAEWKEKLNILIEGYEMKDIANGDESALFYKMLPNKSLQLRGERCLKGKLSKERLTVLLTVFADGTFYQTLVIGKSQNPRCFKKMDKSKLPVKYFANSKAWMTGKIFEQYLVQLNLEMEKSNRHILLFLDNATSHPKILLSNVKLVFFPPITTAVLQPLDNGVIQNMKVNYRKLVLKNILVNIDLAEKVSELTSSINVLDAIMYVSEAIKCIKKDTVQKCFKNCGFPIQLSTLDDVEPIEAVRNYALRTGESAIFSDIENLKIKFLNLVDIRKNRSTKQLTLDNFFKND